MTETSIEDGSHDMTGVKMKDVQTVGMYSYEVPHSVIPYSLIARRSSSPSSLLACHLLDTAFLSSELRTGPANGLLRGGCWS